MPITFVERELGDSKMSQRIVIEALLRTTAWGIAHRAGQLRDLASRRRAVTPLRLRRGLPLVLFTILAVGLPILEFWLPVQVGQAIGVLPTILLLVVIAGLGGWLISTTGSASLEGAERVHQGSRADRRTRPTPSSSWSAACC